jgi:hypothetical protein
MSAKRTKSRRRVAVAVAVPLPLAVIATGVARADEPPARSVALGAADACNDIRAPPRLVYRDLDRRNYVQWAAIGSFDIVL